MPPVLGFIGTYNPNGTGGSIDNQLGIDEIFDINRDFLIEDYDRSILTVDQMAFANLGNGPYFGRTRISNNLFSVENIGASQPTSVGAPLTPASLFFTACSATGQFMAAAGTVDPEHVYISSDWGKTWSITTAAAAEPSGGALFNAITVSADGKFIYAASAVVGVNNTIYRSDDYGATWSSVRVAVEYYNGIATSSDGRFVLVTSWQSIATNTRHHYLSSDYGDTWTDISASTPAVGQPNLTQPAMSSDGKIMIIGFNSSDPGSESLISYDYGATWGAAGDIPSGRNIYGAGMSANGRYMLLLDADAGNEGGFVSNDYGQTWVFKTIAAGMGFALGGVSADGRIMIACSGTPPGGIYISHDSGDTWNKFDYAADGSWFCVSMSADCNIILASANINGLYIYTADTYISGSNTIMKAASIIGDHSEDYARSLFSVDQVPLSILEDGFFLGNTKIVENNYYIDNIAKTWEIPSDIPVGGLPAANDYFLGTAISADGKILMAFRRGQGLWVSRDYGKNWVLDAGAPGSTWGMAMSTTGKHIMRAAYGGQIYVSHDYGVTWPIVTGPVLWWVMCAASADGKYMIAGNNDGGQFGISNDYGDTWRFISMAGTFNSTCCMSSDGKVMIISTSDVASYISYDYGITWAVVSGIPGGAGFTFAISASGRHIVSAGGIIPNRFVYISHDYGQNWSTSYGVDKNWGQAGMSGDGQIIVLSIAGGADFLYVSTDSGLTWTASGDPLIYRTFCRLSASGTTIFCATVWNSMPNKGGIELSRADTIVNASNLLIPACPSEILDADMPESSYVAWIDEGTDMLEFKVKYSDGTVKSVSIGPLLV